MICCFQLAQFTSLLSLKKEYFYLKANFEFIREHNFCTYEKGSGSAVLSRIFTVR